MNLTSVVDYTGIPSTIQTVGTVHLDKIKIRFLANEDDVHIKEEKKSPTTNSTITTRKGQGHL